MRIALPSLAGAVLLGGVFATATVSPARATQLTAQDILSSFNAVIAGNFSTRSDTEGAIVVGGNLTRNGSGTLDSNKHLPGGSLAGFGHVNVYGNTNRARYNANGLVVDIAGRDIGGKSRFSGASSVSYGAAMPYAFSDLWTPLVAASSGLAQLAPAHQTPLPTDRNNGVLQAVPGSANGVSSAAVINITAGQLASYGSLGLDRNGASTVIINVTGNFTGHPNIINKDDATYWAGVIWNFLDAKSVDFKGYGWAGTVLAPNATVKTGNSINGTLVAGSFTGRGELHERPFTGDLDAVLASNVPPVVPPGNAVVPEPASLALLLAGLGGLALIRRRARG